ncbi:hypothetical protein Godav_027223 [Gossypium davidsonii]|uniref:Uncharacterized protein n=1 Tax=Gossypium davidsonii TaxID=34287 RepID=A0A7J8RVB7_GOSDV|nr:hypothetical protein [Gossypium davidsonii]
MLKRGSITLSMIPNSTLLMGWCRGRKRVKRRRGSTVRLGNKAKRRGFWLGSRSVVQWGVMVGPLRMLKKIITEITVKEKFIEAYYMVGLDGQCVYLQLVAVRLDIIEIL